MPSDCIFCKIRDGIIPSEILHQDDTCFVIRDIAPKAPSHLLVIPNQHFTELTNLTSDQADMMHNMFLAAKKMAEAEGIDGSGYRLIINQGVDSGQEVPHLHLHVLGGRKLSGMG